MQGSGLVCHLHTLDWAIIAGFIAFSLAIGVIFSRRAHRSTKDYFKSGEGLPWWLLGTSMVATTFAADTPLALCGMVVAGGIAQNWYWWCGVPMVMGGVFFFARLWKRANPMTDMEFVHQRYSGKSASFLRGFRGLWMALVHGAISLGWVNLAMATIIRLIWPVIPRIVFVDSLMLTLFLATPLSNNVDRNIADAVRRGEIKPLDVAYDYGILKDPVLWSEIRGGVYRGNEQEALRKLGVEDRLASTTIAAFPAEDIPPHLYIESERNNLKSANVPLKGYGVLQTLSEIYTIASSVNQYKILFILFFITCAYVAIGGLWGVVVADFFQFWIAVAGCLLLAILAIRHTGGIDATLMRMAEIYGPERARAMTSLIPSLAGSQKGISGVYEFLIYITIIWWASGLSDGGGYAAQRMLSAKDERHAAMGYLWFGVAHFALRMWPWILVGLSAAVLFPFVPYQNGAMPPGSFAEEGYVKVMILMLPRGLLGVLAAAFLAAYMSTISTVVNLSAAYLMNDVYRPFVAPRLEVRQIRRAGGAGRPFTEKHYVRMGIIFTLLVSLLGIAVSLSMNSIKHAWFLLSSIYGGIGLIFILRWYWHRINAWTEVACMASLLMMTLGMWFLSKWLGNPKLMPASLFPYNALFMVPVSVGGGAAGHLFDQTCGEGAFEAVLSARATGRSGLGGD